MQQNRRAAIAELTLFVGQLTKLLAQTGIIVPGETRTLAFVIGNNDWASRSLAHCVGQHPLELGALAHEIPETQSLRPTASPHLSISISGLQLLHFRPAKPASFAPTSRSLSSPVDLGLPANSLCCQAGASILLRGGSGRYTTAQILCAEPHQPKPAVKTLRRSEVSLTAVQAPNRRPAKPGVPSPPK